MMSKFLLSGIFILFFTGCIYGPENPHQTFTEKLNHDSYDSAYLVMGVPVLNRKLPFKKVTGKVYCGEGISLKPINHATVNLVENDKIISTVSTDTNGFYVFTFNFSVENPQQYLLQCSEKCGQARKEISFQKELGDLSYDLFLK